LTGLAFAGLSFTGLAFTGLSFTGLALTGLALTGLTFTGLTLTSLSFTGLSLTGLTFTGLTLTSLSFTGLSFTGLSFTGLSFTGLTLTGLTLTGLTLTGLAFTSLAFTSLSFTSLAFASLSFTSLSFTSLSFTSLAFTGLAFTSFAFASLTFTSLALPGLALTSFSFASFGLAWILLGLSRLRVASVGIRLLSGTRFPILTVLRFLFSLSLLLLHELANPFHDFAIMLRFGRAGWLLFLPGSSQGFQIVLRGIPPGIARRLPGLVALTLGLTRRLISDLAVLVALLLRIGPTVGVARLTGSTVARVSRITSILGIGLARVRLPLILTVSAFGCFARFACL